MEDVIQNLKRNIFYRARIFIEDIGSFSPFGAKAKGQDIVDIMAYKDFEESIEGIELIDMLRGNFTKELEMDAIQAGAIAYDVAVELQNADGVFQKRDALCLITSTDGKNWEEEYFPYMLVNGECIWR
ncbi:hypothetical protein AAEO56_02695 [Flavobacterium sp. DGU11]|uniref:Uncharacterized protein n=1 Tax=Flavobacterium arundinis TaxID=3139143 RepID=A0ABU9HTX5_9FLAO